MHRIRVVRRAPPSPAAHRVRGAGDGGKSPPHPIRVPRRARRAHTARRWRQRREKGQVAAVATILGLMIVVTLIANYISTTLPSQMSVNDVNRGILVQNEVGRLQSLAEAVANRGLLGSVLSQPIALGSDAAPPFAGPDGGELFSAANGTHLSLTYTVSGPITFNPPTGFPLSNPANLPSGCTVTSGTLTCPAVNRADPIGWNFSGADGTTYTVTLGTGGNHVQLNFATNHSAITISGISGMPIFIQILGSNDTLTLSNNGGGNNPISVNITGSFDTITPGSFPGGASTIIVRVVGNNDYINGDPSSGGNTMYVSFIGEGDTLAVTPGSGSSYYTYFTGFNALHPTSGTCPYGALAHTDSVTGYTVANGQSANAHLTQTFNNSTSNPGNSSHSPSSRWSITNQTVAPFACPYTTSVQIPVSSALSSGFSVGLYNNYAPAQVVAFDEGAVVVAQPGGNPLILDAPAFSLIGQALTLVVPVFSGNVASDVGVGTAVVELRLISDQKLVLPVSNYQLANGSSVSIAVTSQFASAWMGYFATAGFAGATCAGPSAACAGPFTANGPLGTVTVSVPVSILSVTIATFAISLA